MLYNERGFSVYYLISIILMLVLIFILALPSFFNLDKGKNEEDCLNNMKKLWVATVDYMKDTGGDFNGNLEVLKNTLKKGSKKDKYIETIPECPESSGSGNNYIIYGKYFVEEIEGTQKYNFGVIVLCPNLNKFPKHLIPKSFYENMEASELQNYFIDDLDAIDTATGTDGQKKLDYALKYIEIWKNDPSALKRIRENNQSLRNEAMGLTPPPTKRP